MAATLVTGPGIYPVPGGHTADGHRRALQQFTQEFRLSGENADGMFWQAGYVLLQFGFHGIDTNPFFVPTSRR